MTDKPGNKRDAWLDDESTVSRAYGELQRPGPPTRLDEKILAEARHAIEEPDNVVIRVQHWRKWTMPAALAATVVFAVPLVVRVFDTMSTDFEAGRAPTMTVSDVATTKSEVAEADRDSAAPAPSTAANESQVVQPIAPQALAPSPARSLLPQEERRVETRKTGSYSAATDPSAAGSGKGARPSAPADSAEAFATPPPASKAGAFIDDAGDAAPAMASQPRFQAGEMTHTESHREEDSRADDEAAVDRIREDMRYRAMRQAETPSGVDFDAAASENQISGVAIREPQQWLIDIAAQHRRGLVRTARRGLGSFLTNYPDYPLPDDYPLQVRDARYGDEEGDIVPEAAAWLRGIGLMAEGGQVDQARAELAEFLGIYPDYPLPQDFPLTHDDARPIER